MKSSKMRSVTVRFADAGLRDCFVQGITEVQRRQLAAILAEDPTSGSPRKNIGHLRCLPWPVPTRTGKTVELAVWYLFVRGTPHVEVIAICEPDDAVGDRFNTAQALKLVAKIAIAIRAAYSGGKVVKKLFDHWSDFTDFFG
jgi:hypothetical protein